MATKPKSVGSQAPDTKENVATTGQEVFMPGGKFYDPNGPYGPGGLKGIDFGSTTQSVGTGPGHPPPVHDEPPPGPGVPLDPTTGEPVVPDTPPASPPPAGTPAPAPEPAPPDNSIPVDIPPAGGDITPEPQEPTPGKQQPPAAPAPAEPPPAAPPAQPPAPAPAPAPPPAAPPPAQWTPATPPAPFTPGGADPGIPESGTGIPAEQTDWDVTEEQTVMGQLEKNYDKDSPFFQLAAERAKRAHQASGGQNSLMASQAGIMAAMDTAFKVSAADALTYARSAEFNAAMKNQFGLAEQRFIHNATLSKQNFQHSKILLLEQIRGQLANTAMQVAGATNIAGMQIAGAKDVAGMQIAGRRDVAGMNIAGRRDVTGMQIAGQHENTRIQVAGQLENTQLITDASMDRLWAGAAIHENQESAGWARTMALNGATAGSNFMAGAWETGMAILNDPNLTPAQAAAGFKSNMESAAEQFAVIDAYWLSRITAGPGGSSPAYPYSDSTAANYGDYPEPPTWDQWYQDNYGG